MSRFLRYSLLLLAAVLVAGPASAQHICPAGYPATTPDSDFVDTGNGTVLHIPTGLTWKRCAEGQSWNGLTCGGSAVGYTWQEAIERADAVNAGAQGWNAGQTDWRVPNQKELSSIVERGCSSPSINLSQFPATPTLNFWSSSPVAGTATRAWNVNFSYGYHERTDRTSALAVRLVRGGLSVGSFDALLAPTIAGALPMGNVGTAYSFVPTVTGSPTFSATGLPPGLSINPVSGAISGTPTVEGSYGVVVIASNAAGSATLSAPIVIMADPALQAAPVPMLSRWATLLLVLVVGVLVTRRRRAE